MTIGRYEDNSLTESSHTGHRLGYKDGLNITGFFHTHPSLGFKNSDRLVPSDKDLDVKDAGLKQIPNLKFFLLTQPENYGNPFPNKIDYTTGYQRRLN